VILLRRGCPNDLISVFPLGSDRDPSHTVIAKKDLELRSRQMGDAHGARPGQMAAVEFIDPASVQPAPEFAQTGAVARSEARVVPARLAAFGVT
jgi:hypothetical protein